VTIERVPDIRLDEEEFLEAQGRSLRLPAARDVARRQLALARQLVSPAIILDWFAVDRLEERRVVIDGVVFGLGRHADLLDGAQEVLLAVVTIGPALEERCCALQEAGEPLELFLLHEAGVFAVGKLVEQAHAIAEAKAAEQRWGVSAELAPGQLAGWATSEQKLFSRLLDLESIGAHVTDGGLLVPQKSVSLMIGAGPGLTAQKVHSPCAYCDLGGTCTYRH
jgi:hypothetical protein